MNGKDTNATPTDKAGMQVRADEGGNACPHSEHELHGRGTDDETTFDILRCVDCGHSWEDR